MKTLLYFALVLFALSSAAQAEDTLNASLESIVYGDSQSWVFNRYDRGSMHAVRILEQSKDRRRATIYGEYTFNGGMAGWVKARIDNGRLDCLEFWDFRGTCRPFGRSPSQAIAGQIFAEIVVGGFGNGSSNNSSSSDCDDACQHHNWARTQNSIARQSGQPEPYPGEH